MMKYVLGLVAILVVGLVFGLLPAVSQTAEFDLSGYGKGADMDEQSESNLETAVIGGGCFWCMEAVFERIGGVRNVVSGYAGGRTEHPTYQEVSSGRTGHAEVVSVTFDPEVISYDRILEVFFKSHDPTTPNRQGADYGTQYRSIILYENDVQKASAERAVAEFRNLYDAEIVTEIKSLGDFYEAEEYHQDYFAKNPAAGYCRAVIAPKLDKLGLGSVKAFYE